MNLASSARQSVRRVSSFTRTIPASFLRGGTSKGIFLHQSHLPQDKSKWDEIFLGLMGSPDPEYGRQLNGMGGGISSLSKICVVQPASPEQQKSLGVDVEYTFVQVGIRDTVIDYSGNCGNLSSMIGVFALDEGMVNADAVNGQVTIRSFNTNTQKVVNTTFPVEESGLADLSLPETRIAGVTGEASQIRLDFHKPGGARTGKLMPSDAPIIRLEIKEVVVASGTEDSSSAEQLRLLESLRREGAIQMGLDPNTQAQPKIAMLQPPSSSNSEAHVEIIALSMGVPHKAVPMTVGLCLGVAASVKGTLPYTMIQSAVAESESGKPNLIKIRHPGGVVEVGAIFDAEGEVESASVIRTGRRLMKGHVWY
ncbi:PrpF protein [Rhodocollybia butyracea]|uniref:PrpF protein n=1 Tax=Rhodocollybia butyracea TaxID=206335 RepID=A0A9P5PVX6_9AGAR|nr:PrpF protein [Rhodocollybia butyracea]